MRKLIILIFLFTLYINVTYAAFPYSEPLNKTGNETFDNDASMVNWSISFSGSATSNGKLSLDSSIGSGHRIKYVHTLHDPTVQPWSARFKLNISNSTAGCLIFDTNNNNISGGGQLLSVQLEENLGNFRLRNPETGSTDTCDGLEANNTVHDITIKAGTDGALNLSINNTQKCSLAWKTPGAYQPKFFVWIGTQTFTPCGFTADNWVAMNQTKYPVPDTSDTTPPTITNYSSQGSSCTNWNTNISNPCTTSDVTPSIYFNTSESAFCAIGTNNSNYTTMGSSRNCTVGEGTIEHACDLTPQDELVYDTSYVYISCKDANNNQNNVSTSGALVLSITGLEATGRDSLSVGIQNALLNSYTNYTDLQIYARNLSNGQVRGTFDRAAKKGSKMWAFNRIGVSDSYVNMFNLTPILHTLELANKTSSNITLQVELLINATK